MKYIKQKNLIKIAISLVVMSMVILFIIMPNIDYIKKTKEQIKTERAELERRYQRIIYLKQNADRVKEIEQRLNILDELFLLNDQELKFITTLELIAEKNNVSQKINLKSINLNDPQQTSLPFAISANGSFNDIISFLLEIEQLSYYTNFNSLKISSKSANKEKDIDIILNGEIYLLK